MHLCSLCPRNCHVDRDLNLGVCNMTDQIYLARAALHYWEEPCISGNTGSGTVFFCGCNLHCVYCQNYEIAHAASGKEVSLSRLADIFLELQDQGAANLNLVTPTHYVLQIISAVKMARNRGLKIPLVYNTSGYEKVETLKMLEGIVDVYLTDFKYWEEKTALAYSKAGDYPKVAKMAVEEMVSQVPHPVFDKSGMMQKGVIVRHLLLPGHVHEAKNVVKYLYETYGSCICLSLLNQYTPSKRLQKKYPEIARKTTKREYDALTDYACTLGIGQAYIQEGDTAKESFIPSFHYEGV